MSVYIYKKPKELGLCLAIIAAGVQYFCFNFDAGTASVADSRAGFIPDTDMSVHLQETERARSVSCYHRCRSTRLLHLCQVEI